MSNYSPTVDELLEMLDDAHKTALDRGEPTAAIEAMIRHLEWLAKVRGNDED